MHQILRFHRTFLRTAQAFTMSVALLTIPVLSVSGCCKSGYEKTAEGQVNGAQKSAAEKFGTTTLNAWAKDQYPLVGDEAAPEFRTAQSEAAQKTSDKTLEQSIGDFKSMVYVETGKAGPNTLYRFKATFSKSSTPQEVRVVYDPAGKIAGFWIKPWSDTPA